MSINMANVKKIQMPFSATIYKKTFSFTNENVVYRGTSTPCPIDVTLYSNTTPAWTGGSDTSTTDLWDYVHTTLGYPESGGGGRIYMVVDNPYEFEYIYNNQSCVLASCQLRNTGTIGGSYLLPWFSVPGAGSVHVGSAYTITEKTGWVLVGTFNEYEYYLKLSTNTTAGSYYFFSVSKDIITGEEYISNYCINGVSYPNVTISSVSGDTYNLSDGNSYTITKFDFKTFGGIQEVKKIEDNNGNVLWQKKAPKAYHIKVGNYYINKSSTYYVTTSTTASTIWYLDEDNRMYCLDVDTKLYLQCQTSGNHTVYMDTKESSGYEWLYKNGNYITATINGTTYYLYRYGTGTSGVRMRTTATTITFEPLSS